ncbi:Aste57867_14115 [Aphanomyces stellatus]|uniref:Aste57867_14115 protein n=1 Tax=Aphanomyces stellatus TaxID=120398 RepID=A0A485L0R9_9STRA|nr:hypothetical protein As57867_014064 [Aphanomyces stellatus]VFT90942.1 Aste57867_14115 [Aphanomyces stellatus]
MMASVVLRCPDVLPSVWAYQPGLWRDMLPFQRLDRPPLATLYPNGSIFSWAIWSVHSTTAVSHAAMGRHFQALDDRLGPWLAQYGTAARLAQLIRHVPRMKAIAMDFAVYFGHDELVRVLRTHHRAVVSDTSLLEVAVAGGHASMLDLLGRSSDFRVDLWTEAARRAAHTGRWDLFRVVCKYQRPSDGDPYILLEATRQGQIDMLAWLLTTLWPNIDDDQRCEFTKWCIRFASKWGQADVARWLSATPRHVIDQPLMAQLAAPERRDVLKQGFRLACNYGHLAMLAWFVEDCAMPRADFESVLSELGGYALENAARAGATDLAQYLVALGVRPSVEALFEAAASGQWTMVDMLLRLTWSSTMLSHQRIDFAQRLQLLTTTSKPHVALLRRVVAIWQEHGQGDDESTQMNDERDAIDALKTTIHTRTLQSCDTGGDETLGV